MPGLGRSPGEGKGYPFQYSGLENSMDYAVHGVAKSWTRLSDFHFQKVGKCKKRRSSLLWLEPFCFSLWYRIHFCIKVEMLVAQLHPTHCDPHGHYPTRFLCPWNFPGKKYRSRLPFPFWRDLPDPGIKPGSAALQADSLLFEPPGNLWQAITAF